MEFLQVPYKETTVKLYAEGSRAKVRSLGGETGLVPVLKDGDLAIWDTLAIVEYMYEKHPQVWPPDRRLRARARSICGEVHSAMSALREAMPVNTRGRFKLKALSEPVRADIKRVVDIWGGCLSHSNGPWLFGDFTAADIVFAPIATRFQTYGIELSGCASGYKERLLLHPLVERWLVEGKHEPDIIEEFEIPFKNVRES
jgi:glutathione S-transferase